MDAVWIITCGILIVISCSLLGCFLVLRKIAMIGDAISHAILPGIVIAFLFQNSFNSFYTFLGAIIVGLLTTFLISYINKHGNLQLDASIGTVFTSLFALGAVLIALYAKDIDIDQDCVLYGEIAFITLNMWITEGGTSLGPVAFWQLSLVAVIIVSFVVWGYSYLKITTFDPTFAVTLGISTTLWHYLLMGAVSLATVASFEAVGAILVIAIMIVPPSAAYLLTEKLKTMCFLAVGLGILAVLGGYFLAVYIDSSIAGAIATVSGLIFLVAVGISVWWKRQVVLGFD